MKIAGRTLNKDGKIALAIIIILIIGIALSLNLVYASDEPVIDKGDIIYEVNLLDSDLETVNVVIRNGDTAWTIQSELTPDKDVSEIISQLEEMNKVDLEEMKPGDIVQFAKIK